jgi:hypothetical protein
MADNTDEEHLDIPSNTQSENSADEIIPTTDTETINLNQEIENMEVHKHPHHVTHKKKWGEYLLEFFMLFLAVFLGFLAENQREHTAEHERAKQYAISLIKDLENDTSHLQEVIRMNKIILTSFDSISSIIHRGITNNKVTGSFYFYCQIAINSSTVVWNDASLIQITQSGSLRYFTNPEVVNKISNYFSKANYVRVLNTIDKSGRDKSQEIKSRIVNNYYSTRYSSYITDDWLHLPDSLMNNFIPLQTNDTNLLNEFANSLENRRRLLSLAIKKTYPDAIKNAEALILLLRHEYKITNKQND